ncbi:CocE/NonD family hydrolase [Candidatus Binatia bacterium]|nr:CocE/NonD family hydrolase [Candidatus Binatia bacterium]
MRRLSPLVVLVCLVVATAARAIELQPGIRMLAVTDAEPGSQLVLDDGAGDMQTGIADRFGSYLFRELIGAHDYTVRPSDGSDPKTARVLRFEDKPGAEFYQQQELKAGFQYIKMRDGTLLSATVRFPSGPPPYPTVVEYSGYATSDPGSPQPTSLLAGVLGYATVGVNMRGSGCSGGVMDLFDLPTTADGYDVVETVAAQPWVKGGKVGMIGISFSGISQVFVGGAQPPHLAALAPLSFIANIYESPGFPGGIFNNGFAESWLRERGDDAKPAPEGGQGWARQRVRNGDAICAANQKLRLQTQDPVETTRDLPYYTPELMDRRSPESWVRDVKVPMLLSATWQDEQTGGGFASLLSMVPRRPDVKIDVLNGVHASPLEPQVLWHWHQLLEIYVAHRVPNQALLRSIAAVVVQNITGGPVLSPKLPPNRYDGITDYDQARALFESDPFVRVSFENGAGTDVPGLPGTTFDVGFSRWPAREIEPTAWWFDADGTLSSKRPRSDGIDAYHPDPDARPQQTLPGDGSADSWVVMPPYDWRPFVDGTAVAYATEPLADDVTIVGPGSVDLWLRSSADDSDLQVTLSEVRPDGLETYVQSGWLRASHRKLGRTASKVFDPRHTHLERDAKSLPDGRFTKVRVGLLAVGHVFRKGSRIRIGIAAPGGDRTRWRFATPETDGMVLNEIARGRLHPSRIVLPVVPGIEPPAELPPCPGLRGQPCRTYVPAVNGG